MQLELNISFIEIHFYLVVDTDFIYRKYRSELSALGCVQLLLILIVITFLLLLHKNFYQIQDFLYIGKFLN